MQARLGKNCVGIEFKCKCSQLLGEQSDRHEYHCTNCDSVTDCDNLDEFSQHKVNVFGAKNVLSRRLLLEMFIAASVKFERTVRALPEQPNKGSWRTLPGKSFSRTWSRLLWTFRGGVAAIEHFLPQKHLLCAVRIHQDCHNLWQSHNLCNDIHAGHFVHRATVSICI
jgi:hypothetical protein